MLTRYKHVIDEPGRLMKAGSIMDVKSTHTLGVHLKMSLTLQMLLSGAVSFSTGHCQELAFVFDNTEHRQHANSNYCYKIFHSPSVYLLPNKHTLVQRIHSETLDILRNFPNFILCQSVVYWWNPQHVLFDPCIPQTISERSGTSIFQISYAAYQQTSPLPAWRNKSLSAEPLEIIQEVENPKVIREYI